ncbi:unnamed protein product [Phaeothamnion confervicola]
MLRTARRKRQREEETGGLIIYEAKYGRELHVDCGQTWYMDPAVAAGDADGNEEDGRGSSATTGGGGAGGDTADLFSPAKRPPNIDVTIQVQFFVKGSSLRLPPRSKAGLLGFYREADAIFDVHNVFGWRASKAARPGHGTGGEGEGAQLWIRYEFAGRVYEITVQDCDPVVLPSPEAQYIGPAPLVR